LTEIDEVSDGNGCRVEDRVLLHLGVENTMVLFVVIDAPARVLIQGILKGEVSLYH
jgi:hypothetical protein